MTRGPDRKVTRSDVLAEVEPGKPETASTLADRLPCHRDTVFNRLKELHELDEVATKEAGGRSRVWWIPDPNTEISDSDIDPSDFQSTKDPKILRSLARAANRDEPLTSGNIADEVGETQDIVYNRLRKLEERGWVGSLKAGATSKVWWIERTEPPKSTQTQTTITISEALKSHLWEVKETVEGVDSLHEALLYILENPHDETRPVEGYDETLNDPIKVPEETLDEVRVLRDEISVQDYEAAIRKKANIERRDVGEEPVDVSGFPPEERTGPMYDMDTIKQGDVLKRRKEMFGPGGGSRTITRVVVSVEEEGVVAQLFDDPRTDEDIQNEFIPFDRIRDDDGGGNWEYDGSMVE
ncbi:helix-turn-helix transcriptional regulator [Halorientalis regularis]|uniref:CodY helix-turn-helix domain-containing protein n=1 Tax=Halorientalis regularis TaxID=660518 RepID=A0A1G7U317_9EURY|nr:helix-turn-helix transcriptional regulator [Halorientalis regularis]SDG41956.1 CodY helix-turn-helix domain-containing protein [Halorientalis regularis]